MLIVSDEELGTPESAWLADPAVVEARPLDRDLDLDAVGRLVVVAPHPDDEILGAAGLLLACARRGAAIEIVAVTDGEASHPDAAIDRAALGRRRRDESATARHRLGIAVERIHPLALPDGRVADHEDELASLLASVLGPSTTCATTWRHDGHPDHDATGRAAARAVGRTGAALVEFPIWAWHRCTPGEAFPDGSLARLDLSPADHRSKLDAIDAFRSQIAPLGPGPGERAVLPPAIRARFERTFETYLPGTGR